MRDYPYRKTPLQDVKKKLRARVNGFSRNTVMSSKINIFVVDTSPLITLAAAQSLDYLLYVENATVIIPDAVFYEAIRDASKLGATDVMAWVKNNHKRIEIAPTNAYLVFDTARQTNPNIHQPNLGEQAAVEVIEEPGRLGADERGVLLCEETAVLKRITVQDKEKIVELSTLDFLRVLEAEQRIQSADAVFEQAILAGRTPSTVEKMADHEKRWSRLVRQFGGLAKVDRVGFYAANFSVISTVA